MFRRNAAVDARRSDACFAATQRLMFAGATHVSPQRGVSYSPRASALGFRPGRRIRALKGRIIVVEALFQSADAPPEHDPGLTPWANMNCAVGASYYETLI